MTKKHFKQIAQILKNQRLSIQEFSNDDEFGTQHLFENIIMNIENQLINVFVDDNPRFDISRFRQATQPTEEELRLAI
tara:strand:+ start:471 stop:704 length:234 start_codon:yes stop_codon:yes gene_type:complete